ncbi:phosphoglycerate mutase-like protein [Biscogniauxia sp. FL1348]|nr:phosphoglycerate mutase-like protein [Biscogniauxia sp. FL1348]
MAPVIHIIRHAQAWSNLPGYYDVRDPILTPFGRLQCAHLLTTFPHMDKVTALLASPMKRTISTCILSFLPVSDKRITLMAELQEVGSWNCDIGNDMETIRMEFGKRVDTSLVKPGWNDKNPTTEWAADVAKVEARARTARQQIRRLASLPKNSDAHIVVVTHGIFAHWLTQDFGGVGGNGPSWGNAEYRSYQFVDLVGEDAEAAMVEMDSSIQRRNGTSFWTLSPAERAKLKNISAKMITG